jgi:hypothetical protein
MRRNGPSEPLGRIHTGRADRETILSSPVSNVTSM